MAVFTIELPTPTLDFLLVEGVLLIVMNVGNVGLNDFPLGSGNLKTLGLVGSAAFCCLEIVDPRSVVISKVS